MKLLRFLAFFLSASTFLLLASLAQTSPPPGPASPAVALAQTPSQPHFGEFLHGALGPSSNAPQSRTFELRRSRRLNMELAAQDKDELPPPQIGAQWFGDPGIYVPKPADGVNTMCGSIVSYNFSPGPNPELENVTTCTSLDQPLWRRTHRVEPKALQPGHPMRWLRE